VRSRAARPPHLAPSLYTHWRDSLFLRLGSSRENPQTNEGAANEARRRSRGGCQSALFSACAQACSSMNGRGFEGLPPRGSVVDGWSFQAWKDRITRQQQQENAARTSWNGIHHQRPTQSVQAPAQRPECWHGDPSSSAGDRGAAEPHPNFARGGGAARASGWDGDGRGFDAKILHRQSFTSEGLDTRREAYPASRRSADSTRTDQRAVRAEIGDPRLPSKRPHTDHQSSSKYPPSTGAKKAAVRAANGQRGSDEKYPPAKKARPVDGPAGNKHAQDRGRHAPTSLSIPAVVFPRDSQAHLASPLALTTVPTPSPRMQQQLVYFENSVRGIFSAAEEQQRQTNDTMSGALSWNDAESILKTQMR
jgi:hypothetical protein